MVETRAVALCAIDASRRSLSRARYFSTGYGAKHRETPSIRTAQPHVPYHGTNDFRGGTAMATRERDICDANWTSNSPPQFKSSLVHRISHSVPTASLKNSRANPVICQLVHGLPVGGAEVLVSRM